MKWLQSTDSLPGQGRPLKTPLLSNHSRPRVQKDMPSSKVSNAGCSSGVYSLRRSSERATAILSKSLVKLSLIQILPNSGWDCFQVWFPKLLISVGDSLSSGSSGPIRLNHKARLKSILLSQAFKAKSQNSSPEWYTAPSSGIYRDFDYSDLATSSYLLGTHHEIIHLQFGQ